MGGPDKRLTRGTAGVTLLRVNIRRQTRLTTYSFAVLVVYAPIEIWYSSPQLWDPFFLVDLIGIVLLGVGAVRYRRTGAPTSLGMLIAGYAWTSANFWRALFDRLVELRAGGTLDYGLLELCFTTCILVAAVIGLVWSLLVSRSASAHAQVAPPVS
jgi:hypothetical protein